jgi:hypothetical protein
VGTRVQVKRCPDNCMVVSTQATLLPGLHGPYSGQQRGFQTPPVSFSCSSCRWPPQATATFIFSSHGAFCARFFCYKDSSRVPVLAI